MIVFAWFALIAIIMLVGFGLVIATFIHWYKESRRRANADDAA